MNQNSEINSNQDQSATQKFLTMNASLSILTWILILVSVAGMFYFPYANFRNHNFAYYLNMTGHYLSFGSFGLLVLFIEFLWRAYRKGLRVQKVVWIQLGLLLLLAFSLGIAYCG